MTCIYSGGVLFCQSDITIVAVTLVGMVAFFGLWLLWTILVVRLLTRDTEPETNPPE